MLRAKLLFVTSFSTGVASNIHLEINRYMTQLIYLYLCRISYMLRHNYTKWLLVWV